jgi:hypothetical protein
MDPQSAVLAEIGQPIDQTHPFEMKEAATEATHTLSPGEPHPLHSYTDRTATTCFPPQDRNRRWVQASRHLALRIVGFGL